MSRLPARRALPALALAMLLPWGARYARAGNEDPVFLGNQAALTGGAVEAIVSRSGAAWYNPAGLAHIRRNSVDLSASAFTLTSLEVPDVVSVESEHGSRGSRGLSVLRLRTIPSALAFSRRLSGCVTGAIGVFVPRLVDDEAEAVLENEPTEEFGREALSVARSRSLATYYFTVALGYEPHPRLRLGAAVVIVYYHATAIDDFSAAFGEPGSEVAGAAFSSSTSRVEDLRVGIGLNLGLQWEPIDGFHVGIVARSPIMMFYQDLEVSTSVASGGELVAAGEGSSMDLEASDREYWDFRMTQPARFHLGFAWEFDDGWVGLSADLQHGMKDEQVGVDLDVVWNIRAGVNYEIDEQFTFGAGFFTDQSAAPKLELPGDIDVDYYGVALGTTIATGHQLADPYGPATLVFTTTIALRYAVGIGHAAALRYSVDYTTAQLDSEVIHQPVIAHELSLHVGSALHF